MSIIGIFASEKQAKQIRKMLERNEDVKVEIICINPNSIENVKNIKFEIIVIQDSLEKLKENKKCVEELFKNAKYLLLNTDISINEDFFESINMKVLTYGLRRKATLTASGIGENNIIISVQRAFEDLSGKIIEQQEIPIETIKSGTQELYNSLIRIAIINILGDKNR